MSKRSRRHIWGEESCPDLPEHSQAKHQILSEYIQEYLSIVCQVRRIDKLNITLIDGFAGGGIYQDDREGSPIIMINSVNNAIEKIMKERKDIFINPYYFFIEKDKENYNFLNKVVNHRNLNNRNNISIINDDFNSQVEKIISHVKARSPRGGGGAIFFLDQDGYASVKLSNLRRIRKEIPKSEIIININIGWLVDFIEDSDKFRHTISNMDLTQFIDIDEIIELGKNIKETRYIIEAKLSVALQQAVGYPYFRPFFIEPEYDHRGYWLLHLSSHYRAHNAMTDIIWYNGNYMRHYGGLGRNILDISYKGGEIDPFMIFGMNFNKEMKNKHIAGLASELPERIWEEKSISVNKLIETTCNTTAASPEMYQKALIQMQKNKDIRILGSSGGKKRSNSVGSKDIIIPERQIYCFK